MSSITALGAAMLLSVLIGGLVIVLGRCADAFNPTPRQRHGFWGAGLVLCTAPFAILAGAILTPDKALLNLTSEVPRYVTPLAGPGQGWTVAFEAGAYSMIALAVVLAARRGFHLAKTLRGLAALLRQTERAPERIGKVVRDLAGRMEVRPPHLLRSADSPAFLTWSGRTILVLPARLCEAPDSPATSAVCAHELGHLKRGDLWAVWLDALILVVLAFNPFCVLIERRRSAAREEACDALALGDASTPVRRAYARSLIESLRIEKQSGLVPVLSALTFTGQPRRHAMNRLRNILDGAPRSAFRNRLATLAIASVAVSGAGVTSAALALAHNPVGEVSTASREPARSPAAHEGPARATTPAEYPATHQTAPMIVPARPPIMVQRNAEGSAAATQPVLVQRAPGAIPALVQEPPRASAPVPVMRRQAPGRVPVIVERAPPRLVERGS